MFVVVVACVCARVRVFVCACVCVGVLFVSFVSLFRLYFVLRYDWCAYLPVCLWIMDPHSRAPKENTSHANEVLPQDITHLIQRPCYQRGSPCQDPAGNWTTRRPPDHRKETQTAVVCSCLPIIRSGQNHLARHIERGKKQGRERNTWEDNIREWTGLEFGKSQRAVENREK